ncbi:MAG: quercetin 2,3-dioxygenase [Chloroflexota bacterium]|nr:quercetin 2,3-dioxygenase [Chloroflexota bacterium]
MTATTTGSRSVQGILDSVRTIEGGGFSVRRPFPTQTLSFFDPFLLLDEMGPVDYAPFEAVGAPDHPHRGFETVTYLLDGRLQHRDSQGNHGTLRPGDVQWMTAGAGVVHSEMPEDEFYKTGGHMHGFQIWVNLPARDKMIQPRYQDVPTAQIPVVESDDGLVRVKVIAGEALGTHAVIDTHTPIMYLHFTVQPGGAVTQQVPAGYNVFAYVVDGAGEFGTPGRRADEGKMIAFQHNGDEIEFRVPVDAEAPLNVLVLGGVPLDEPVARYGPFVMNTREEIIQVIEDYRAGRMGEIRN